MIRKIVAYVFSFCVICSSALSCYAYDNYLGDNHPSASGEISASSVMPRYVNLGNITAGMSITSDHKAKCNGSFFLYSTKNSDITVSLLRSTDGKTGWTAVSGESWTSSFSTSGNHTGGGTSSAKLSSNYYYCSYVQVNVYDSNGNITETATCYSSTYHL